MQMTDQTGTALTTVGVQGIGAAAAWALADAEVTVAVTPLGAGDRAKEFAQETGMRERGFGRIINISSANPTNGQAGQTNYCAAKSGVEGFTRALARESVGKGIIVNVIAPGYVDEVPDDIIEKILNMVPISRLAEIDEIGRCVRFLASDDAAYITGTTLPVNGGLRMG